MIKKIKKCDKTHDKLNLSNKINNINKTIN